MSDATPVLIVRSLLLAVPFGLVSCLSVVGAAKLAAPGYDAGRVSLGVGWAVVAISAALLVRRWQRVR
jgi:hypothetical protein